DYGSMRVADLYFVYRCLVRAKVAAIRAGERDSSVAAREDLDAALRYCEMATERTKVRRPILLATHGLSGSGKTWLSERLLADLPAVRIRSDRVRKNLAGLGETAHSGSPVGQGIYTEIADVAVYAQMRVRAVPVLQAAHNAILDATFLRHEQRQLARKLAADCGATFLMVKATAPAAELEQRIRARAHSGNDASEADLAVLRHQTGLIEPLSDEEIQTTITVDTGDTDAVSNLAGRIHDRCNAIRQQLK
ncbi:MAG: ATP-binding protein, partial [Woeseiaceae bacterium]|nr:ATP-binding protein [Woeseiaceae bacterium]